VEIFNGCRPDRGAVKEEMKKFAIGRIMREQIEEPHLMSRDSGNSPTPQDSLFKLEGAGMKYVSSSTSPSPWSG